MGSDYLAHGAGAPISEAEAAYFRDREPGTLPKAKILKAEQEHEFYARPENQEPQGPPQRRGSAPSGGSSTGD